MKKLITLLSIVLTVNTCMAQRVKVTDTLKLQLKTVPNQYNIKSEIDYLYDEGWRLLSADRVTDNGKEMYIWKFEKILTYRRKEDK